MELLRSLETLASEEVDSVVLPWLVVPSETLPPWEEEAPPEEEPATLPEPKEVPGRLAPQLESRPTNKRETPTKVDFFMPNIVALFWLDFC